MSTDPTPGPHQAHEERAQRGLVTLECLLETWRASELAELHPDATDDPDASLAQHLLSLAAACYRNHDLDETAIEDLLGAVRVMNRVWSYHVGDTPERWGGPGEPAPPRPAAQRAAQDAGAAVIRGTFSDFEWDRLGQLVFEAAGMRARAAAPPAAAILEYLVEIFRSPGDHAFERIPIGE